MEKRVRTAAAVLLFLSASRAALADTIVLRGKDGGRESSQTGVTVVEDGEEIVKYTKGVAASQAPADQVARIVYEGLPAEFAEAESAAASGDAARAAGLYAKAAEKTARPPARAHVLYRGGEALLAAGRFAEARDLLAQCAAGTGSRLAGLARVQSARCDFYEGQLDRARDALRQAAGRAAGEKEALRRYWLARVLAAKEDWDAARSEFEDAARVARDASPAVFQLVQVRLAALAGRADPAKGVEALEKARAGMTEPAALADGFALLADAYWKLSESATDATVRQDAQVQSAIAALRVVTTLASHSEAAVRAYAAAHRALSALKDRKADEIKAEGDQRFSGTGWAKLK